MSENFKVGQMRRVSSGRITFLLRRKDWAQILWKQIKCGAFVLIMERKVFSKWSLSHKMAFYVFGALERLVFRGAGHFVFSTECRRKESHLYRKMRGLVCRLLGLW